MEIPVKVVDDIASLKGFLPFQLIAANGSHTLAWCDFRGVALEEPFFIRDVFRRAFLPNPQCVATSLHALLEAEEVLCGLKPNGFIFHMSACGSTLLANMLRAAPRNISLGEPNVLYNILTLSLTRDDQEVADLFRNGVSALGQRRLGVEDRYVIKFASAATIFLPIILRAFPDVPRLFLYRDPVEVLFSNMKTPSQEWIFESEVTGLDHAVMTETNTALENCAAALSRSVQAFLDHSAGNHLIANYSQFSPELFERVLSFFGMDASASEIDRMLSATSGHAHHREVAFEPDADLKQSAASPRLKEVARSYLGALYERLEKLRVQL